MKRHDRFIRIFTLHEEGWYLSFVLPFLTVLSGSCGNSCPFSQVSSVQWSVTRQEQVVLSASWDESVRLWDPQALTCVGVFGGHVGNVYAASWSPQRHHTFASVAGKSFNSFTHSCLSLLFWK